MRDTNHTKADTGYDEKDRLPGPAPPPIFFSDRIRTPQKIFRAKINAANIFSTGIRIGRPDFRKENFTAGFVLRRFFS